MAGIGGKGSDQPGNRQEQWVREETQIHMDRKTPIWGPWVARDCVLSQTTKFQLNTRPGGPCVVSSVACLPLGSPLPRSLLLVTTSMLLVKWKPVYAALPLQLCPWCVYMPRPSVVSDSLPPRGLQPARLLCPWNSPDKKIGVGSHALFQGIFLTQGSNPGFLHCRQILYHLSHHLAKFKGHLNGHPSLSPQAWIFSLMRLQRHRWPQPQIYQSFCTCVCLCLFPTLDSENVAPKDFVYLFSLTRSSESGN